MSYIEQCDSYDFARYYNVYQWNDGKTDPGLYFTREAIEAYRTGSDPVMYPNTHWNELMFRKAFLQTKNNINISGGSDKVRYFVSMGYMFQNGLLKQIPDVTYDNNYAYNRYNYRHQRRHRQHPRTAEQQPRQHLDADDAVGPSDGLPGHRERHAGHGRLL